ncbi:MAG: HTTM domain-containing protein [Chloroflexota bacterium]
MNADKRGKNRFRWTKSAFIRSRPRPIQWLQTPTAIMPLVVLRIVFGLLMLVSTIRFVVNGWVHDFYIEPAFHFTYLGFGWVQPLPAPWLSPLLYSVFGIIALSATGIALGAYYRLSITTFFVCFTYIELLDKTYYLNHYYFVSVLSLLLIVLPLHRWLSVDAWRRPEIATQMVPMWTVAAVRLQVGLVYFFAGIAKIKADWLLDAMPLQIWLRANTDFPLLGWLFDYTATAYAMSWGGMLYDLTIPIALLYRHTRGVAYIAVIGFHLMTAMLFPIGMFPFIMMGCTLVFFSWEDGTRTSADERGWNNLSPVLIGFLVLFFAFQVFMPLRHWLYKGNVLWTEEGYRFAWNVMLAEKTGHVTFTVEDPDSGISFPIYPNDYLTYQQEKQMSFQPDMILEFAHYLTRQLQAEYGYDVAIYAEAYVSLNGRPSQLLIDPTVDLTKQVNNLSSKSWILPLVDER